MGVRNRPQSQPQSINYDQARALVSDRNLSQSDVNKIQDGVQKGGSRTTPDARTRARLGLLTMG